MEKIDEKKIFIVYEFGLLLKAIQAFLEVGVGIILFFINTNKVINSILITLHEELVEDPNNFLYNYFIQNTHISTYYYGHYNFVVNNS